LKLSYMQDRNFHRVELHINGLKHSHSSKSMQQLLSAITTECFKMMLKGKSFVALLKEKSLQGYHLNLQDNIFLAYING